jgi:phosphomannomutase
VRIFGTAGIRLRFPDELDPILLYRVGLVLGNLGISRTSHIVYDSRNTSHLVMYGLALGMLSSGIDVYEVGLAPTPIAGFAASRRKSLGISVTASHNPPEYNGFKLYTPDGFESTRDLEEKIELLLDKSFRPVSWQEVGRFSQDSLVVEEYVTELLERFAPSRTTWRPIVIIDCANGATFDVSPRIARMMGARPITMNCNPDGHFAARLPEPRKDVLEQYSGIASVVNASIILAHDGDGDRLAVLDAQSGYIKLDRLLAYYANLALRDKPGHVIASIDTGMALDEVVERHGGRLERYPLGKTHERVKQLGPGNVAVACEPWKLILPSWGHWVDGILQVAIILKNMVETGKPLSKLLEEENIPDYPWDRRSYILDPEEIRDKLYEEAVEELKGLLGEPARIIDIDGFRYEYPDGSWLLVRRSGTEPKLRIYSEAKTNERLREIVSRVEAKIFELAKRLGGKIIEKTLG